MIIDVVVVEAFLAAVILIYIVGHTVQHFTGELVFLPLLGVKVEKRFLIGISVALLQLGYKLIN